MGIVQIILIAVGLAMDACAAAICNGLRMKKIDYRRAVLIAFLFGSFQAIMPLIGWLIGRQFEAYITSVDHWIAFTLLGAIGVNMINEARKKDEDDCKDSHGIKELIVMAFATSIDALAVGITFACLRIDIWVPILFIGIITFAMSYAGVFVGNRFGERYKTNAEYAGGIILIFIGVKILAEHMHWI